MTHDIPGWYTELMKTVVAQAKRARGDYFAEK